MKTLKSTIAAMALGMVGFGAISISADELEEKRVMVQIHKLSDSNTKVDLDINGQAEVFNLPDLEVGETKEIITESGSVISVTKTESGVSVSIDGEEINLPAVGSDMAAHFIKGGTSLHTKVSKGIQVIGDLTEEQMAIIKDAFLAAGVEKQVNFTKGHEMQFISIDGGLHGFDIGVESDSNVNTWVTDEGNVKIIKMGDGNGNIHMQSKVIIIDKDEDKN